MRAPMSHLLARSLAYEDGVSHLIAFQWCRGGKRQPRNDISAAQVLLTLRKLRP